MATLTRTFPWDDEDVLEAEWREMAKHWRSDGILPGVGSGMAVSLSAGLVLTVAAGACWIQGHYGVLDTSTTVTLGAGHATNPRIDLVVLRADFVLNTTTVEVVAGTAAVTPSAPALTQNTALWEIEIARVNVAALAASVTDDNITDRRPVFAVTDRTSPNPVKNASAQIATGGTSIACGTGGATTLDNWYGYRTGSVAGETVSQQTTLGDVQGSAYAFRVQRDAGNVSTAVMHHLQSLATVDSRRFAGRLSVFSFRARKGTNYSAASNTLTGTLYSGTGTDQSLQSGLTGQATVLTVTATVTATWKTFYGTATPGATASQLAVDFTFTPVGTAGAADYVEIKDVRIDEGAYVVPHVPLTYAAELGVSITEGTGINVTGSASTGYVITAEPNGVISGAGVDVTGAGTTASPYVPAARNRLQLANPFSNASGAIWQRGTSITPASGTFAADRFINYYRSDIVWSRQASGDTQGSGWCMRIQRPNGNAVTTATGIAQSCLTADSIRFAGRQSTFSLRVRKGATASASMLSATNIYTGTGTDQSVGAGYTGSANYTVTAPTLTTSWQTISVTFTAGASVTEIGAFLTLAWTGTAGASDYIEIKDLRLDEGPYVLDHVTATYAADLADCQRFFWRCGGVGTTDSIAIGRAYNTTNCQCHIDLPVEMRAAPTMTVGTAASFTVNDGSAVPAASGIAGIGGSGNTRRTVGIDCTTAGGLTAWRPVLVYTSATTGYLDFSAEI